MSARARKATIKRKRASRRRRARLYAQRLCVIGPVCSPGEVRQVELNLVPAVVQPHRHGADERLHPRCALIVACPKPSPDVFIVQHLRGCEKTRGRESQPPPDVSST